MKRKSEDENTPAAVATKEISKKRRRLSEGDELSKPEKKSKLKSKDKSATDKTKKDKKKHKAKKPSSAEGEEEDGDVTMAETKTDGGLPAAVEAPESGNTKSSSKKNKKTKTNKTQPPTGDATAAPPPPSTTTTTPNDAADDNTTEPPTTKKSRFIVFVGNLPYSATAAHVESHFAAVHPTSVRLLHQKSDPSRSRGIAFVEFARYDHMKTCLKTMHHSTFTCPSASGPGSKGKARGRGRGRGKNVNVNGWEGESGGDDTAETRKINVELTAGGGGNTDTRKERIRAKNEKLNEERARRALEPLEKAKAKKAGGGGGGEEDGEGDQAAAAAAADPMQDAVHPSRRRIVPGSS